MPEMLDLQPAKEEELDLLLIEELDLLPVATPPNRHPTTAAEMAAAGITAIDLSKRYDKSFTAGPSVDESGQPVPEKPLVSLDKERFGAGVIAGPVVGPILSNVPGVGPVLRGAGRAVGGLIESLLTPSGAAALPAAILTPAVVLPEMIKSGIDQGLELAAEGKASGDLSKIAEGATLLATAVSPVAHPLSKALTTHGVTEPPPLPRSAQAVRERAVEGAVPPVIEPTPQLPPVTEQTIKTAVKERDVMPGRDWISSSEFEFRKLPEARELVRDLNEAELDYSYRSSHSAQGFKATQDLLSSESQLKVTRALRDLESGKISELSSVLAPDELQAARSVRDYFDTVKERIITEKSDSIRSALDGRQLATLDAMNDGVPLTDAAKLHNLSEGSRAIVQEAFNDLKSAQSWGPENYITHIERGSYRVIDSEGNTVAIGQTRAEAAAKAAQHLKENPRVTELTLTDEFNPGVEFPTQLSRGQYYRLVGRMAEATAEDAKVIQELLRANGSIVAVKPTSKYAGPMQRRRGVLKGEENIFEVLPTYAHVMEKKLALDPVLNRAREILPRLPENARAQIEELIKDVKGRRALGDQIADYILSPLGTKPFGYSRGVHLVNKLTNFAKLGYRPVAAVVNRVSGLMHTWVKTGTPYLLEGRKFLKTEEGQRLVKENEPFIGTNATFGDEAKGRIEAPPWHPMWMFQKAEQINRPEAFASFYKFAEGEMGLAGLEAIRYARDATRFAQFTYNLASLPRSMRGPTGRLFLKFKPYLVKELEFIASLTPEQSARYLLGFFTVGGPMAAIVTLESLPVLGSLGVLQDAKDWLNQNTPAASRGVGGALGVDVSPSVAFQFPQRVPDWFGPAISDLTSLHTDLIKPMLQGENRDLSDFKDWAARLAPMTYYWKELAESAMTEGGWTVDERGRPEYAPSKADKFKMALGAKPLDKAVQDVEKRYLLVTEAIDKKNRARLIEDIIDASEKEDGEQLDTLIEQASELGITAQSIREAAKKRQVPARERIFRLLSKKRRGQEIERLDEQP